MKLREYTSHFLDIDDEIHPYKHDILLNKLLNNQNKCSNGTTEKKSVINLPKLLIMVVQKIWS